MAGGKSAETVNRALFKMNLSLRTFLLAGISATLALPAAGQDVQPQPAQPVPGGDAGQVTAIPTGRVLTLPAAPVYPEVMQWPVQHAQSLLAGHCMTSG